MGYLPVSQQWPRRKSNPQASSRSRPRDVEGEDEASDEGWQAGDVRQSGGGESKAGQEGCQSVRCGSAEEERLSRHFWGMCACGQSTLHALHGMSTAGEVCTCLVSL